MSSLESEIEIIYSRSSGKGGQNVNKVNSKAQLFWKVSESSQLNDETRARFFELFENRIKSDGVLWLSCQSYRSQQQNRKAVIDQLHRMIQRAKKRPKVRRKTVSPKRANEKRLRQKKMRAGLKKERSGNAG